MTPALLLAMIALGWLGMALAMLWGIQRVARRHHLHVVPQPPAGSGPQAEPAESPLQLGA